MSGTSEKAKTASQTASTSKEDDEKEYVVVAHPEIANDKFSEKPEEQAARATTRFIGGGSVTDKHVNIMSTLYTMTAEDGLKATCAMCSKQVLMGEKCCGIYAF